MRDEELNWIGIDVVYEQKEELELELGRLETRHWDS